MLDTAQGQTMNTNRTRHVTNEDTVSSSAAAASPHTSSTFIQQEGYLEARPSIEHPQTPIRQLPSPSPSHASFVSEPIKPTKSHVPATESAFKLPTAPASAAAYSHSRQTAAPEVCNVRAGTVDSRASNFTLPAQSLSGRGTSVSSRASCHSARTGVSHSRKRATEYSLSDDDENVSDYAPSEPDSPSADASKRAHGGRDVPVVKKSKIASNVSQATQFHKNKGKNGYGFKPAVVPKPKPTKSSFSSNTSAKKPSLALSTMSSKPAPVGVTISRKGSTFARSKPTASTSKSTIKKKHFVPQPSRRRAAMHAENKIADIFDDNEEFATERACPRRCAT